MMLSHSNAYCNARLYTRSCLGQVGVALLALAGAAVAQTSPTPGSLDTGFTTAVNGIVYTVAVQPDDKVLVGGEFTRVNGVDRDYLVRLNPDGTIDDSFVHLPGADGTVRSISLQGGGKILLGGDFDSINGASWTRIARLNNDGSVDNGFSPGTGANGRVQVVIAQPDGKVLVGGSFTKINGVTHNYIARLNNDGSVDSGFNANADGTVYAVAVQPDGKVLIGGYFTQVNNQQHHYLTRLNSDGSLDNTFTAGADLTVNAIILLDGGKILVSGEFGRINDVYRTSLARLNTDGSLDNGFSGQTSGSVYAMAVQSDGKIIIGGRFTSVNGVGRNNVARLNANGTLDPAFDVGAGPSYRALALALHSNGKALVGGDFTTFNFVDQPYLARLNGDPATNTILEAMIWTAVEIGWNSESNVLYQIQWAPAVDTNTWFNLGEPVTGNGGTNYVFDSTRNATKRFYRVQKLE
ncbi:MAG: delta-60 repeat domain-containing protein [Candidatus Omnitrophica bacterium]|nr:delta-60 repeat domain-containing protein [Candidatus Omnitrophota bacterium]